MSGLLLEMKTVRQTLRESGVRALFRKYGWKLVFGILAYYIVRDVTLYVLLPMLLYKSLS